MQSEVFNTISPIDNRVYYEGHFANSLEISNALKASQDAHRAWKNTPLEERIGLCRTWLEHLQAQKETLAQELSWQMGRPTHQAQGEIDTAIKRAHYMMSIAKKSLSPLVIQEDSTAYKAIHRLARGTVMIIAPWNYPYLTAINSIIPAILAGNSVILKHSTQTPLCAVQFQQAAALAQLPKGVFQHLFLTHHQTAELLQSQAIDAVVFTGSVKGGLAIRKATANRFIPSGLELGGKDAAYVAPDACLTYCVSELVDGAFYNAGQSCCGVERIYVAKSLFARFVDAYANQVRGYRLGNPLESHTTLGPMVKTQAARAIRQQVSKAVHQGATPLINSDDFPLDSMDSAYLAPQVLVDVDHSMAVMKEESFGPVVGIMAVENEAQALELINDSPYGLTASIWSEDKERSYKMATQIEAGTVFMNRCDFLDPSLAWTGVKDSGMGVSLSTLGFETFLQMKSINFNLNVSK